MNATSPAPRSHPALSVILATAGRFPGIRTTVRHLQRQTVRGQIELILLAPDVEEFGLDPAAAAVFWEVQLIPLGRTMPVGDANEIGIRRARAPVIVLSEDHAFPEPDWAEKLLARHGEGWTAVGPVVRNGNPRSAVSWADFLLGYGPWHEGRRGGPANMLPGHNSSYKREALLRLGSELRALLASETVLQQRLLARDERLYLEDEARIAHLNFARLPVFLAVQFHNGRQFAACRARDWSMGRRLAYAAASPLIPLIRLRRILGYAVPLPARPGRIRVLGALLAGLAVDGVGQFVGHLFGAGSADAFLTRFEYDRIRFITSEDRRAIEVA